MKLMLISKMLASDRQSHRMTVLVNGRQIHLVSGTSLDTQDKPCERTKSGQVGK